MTEVTENEFKAIFQGFNNRFRTVEDNVAKISDLWVSGSVAINEHRAPEQRIILDNIIFQEGIHLNEVYLKELTIQNTPESNLLKITGGNIQRLVIKNCHFHSISFDNCHCDSILIKSNTYIDSLQVTHNGLLNNLDIISNRISEFTFNAGDFANVLIDNCNFNNSLSFNGGTYEIVRVTRTFSDNMTINNSKFLKKFAIVNNERLYGLDISNVTFEGDLEINNTTFTVNPFRIHSETFANFSLTNVSSNQDTELLGGKFQSIIIDKGDFSAIIISDTDVRDLKIFNIKAGRLNFQGGSYNKIELKNNNIYYLDIHDGKFEDTFSVIGNGIIEIFNIMGGHFQSFTLSGGLLKQSLSFIKGNFNDISITGLACIEEIKVQTETSYKTLRIQSWPSNFQYPYGLRMCFGIIFCHSNDPLQYNLNVG